MGNRAAEKDHLNLEFKNSLANTIKTVSVRKKGKKEGGKDRKREMGSVFVTRTAYLSSIPKFHMVERAPVTCALARTF